MTGRQTHRPDAWRRSQGDDRTARAASVVSVLATVIVMLILIAMAIWFFGFASSPLAPYN
jgi:hypothetical protein